MDLSFRPIDVWPDGWQNPDRDRDGSPFKATYSATLELLDRELYATDTLTATVQVDARAGDFRRDGAIRADAKITHPGVILTCDTKALGVLVYSCDRFADSYVWRSGNGGSVKVPGWQSNLRAIALGLEALRKIERYGIADRGQQYAGWKAIGSGVPLGPPAMTVDQAAAFIAAQAIDRSGITQYTAEDVLGGHLADAYKAAARRLHPDRHPDRGGSTEAFRKLGEARRIIAAWEAEG